MVRFKLKPGDWVLGGWCVFGGDLIGLMVMVRRTIGWRGVMAIQRAEGRSKRQLQAPFDSDPKVVSVVCNNIMDDFLNDGSATKKVWVEVGSYDHEVAARKLSYIPWIGVT